MKKILSLVLGLLWALPVWAANCNLFDKNNALLGITVNAQGVFEHNADYNCSNYIPVQNGKTYIRSRNGVAFGVRYHLYDNNKDWLGSQDVQTTGLIEVNNPLAKYVAFAISANFDLSTIQLEQGSTATPYQPYNPSCGCNGTIVNYTSATGTGVQNGTPTPDNPIEPVFYQQGNMILRAVGDYADTYDATTGKITRRIGVKVLDGTEDWYEPNSTQRSISKAYLGMVPSGVSSAFVTHYPSGGAQIQNSFYVGGSYVNFIVGSQYTMEQWKQYLAQQYENGTPVRIYYPLATEVEEDWPASYCETPIKIATTKYNETAFGPLNTALQNAISVVDSVVTQTITQAASIATLQAQKQTRPADDPSDANNAENCPAGKKCLLVEDASGIPHWYEIVENAWDLPVGYTQLEYIESTGTQFIDTGIFGTDGSSFEIRLSYSSLTGAYQMNGWNSDAQIGIDSGAYWWNMARGRTTITLDTIYNTKLVISDNISELYVDGNLEKTSTLGGTHTVKGFGLFATVEGHHRSKEKVYNFVAKDSANRIVMNLVPAKNPDDKIGMYDLANGVFYENAGTGDFIAGPVVQ